EKHNFKLGDRINITGDIYPVDLELTLEMIFDHPRNTEVLMFHREYLDELMKGKRRQFDTVGTFAILARTPGMFRGSRGRSIRCSRIPPIRPRPKASASSACHSWRSSGTSSCTWA